MYVHVCVVVVVVVVVVVGGCSSMGGSCVGEGGGVHGQAINSPSWACNLLSSSVY